MKNGKDKAIGIDVGLIYDYSDYNSKKYNAKGTCFGTKLFAFLAKILGSPTQSTKYSNISQYCLHHWYFGRNMGLLQIPIKITVCFTKMADKIDV